MEQEQHITAGDKDIRPIKHRDKRDKRTQTETKRSELALCSCLAWYGVTIYACLSLLVCVAAAGRVAAVCVWVHSLFVGVVTC